MPTAHPSAPRWRKSTRTHQTGECVEVADFTNEIGVRDSKNPDGGVLHFDRATFGHLLAKVRNGQLDL